MKSGRKVSRRYAKALFELTPAAELDVIRAALTSFATEFDRNVELRQALRNPAINLAERFSVVDAIVKLLLPSSDILSRFIARLLENKRLDNVHDVADAFGQLVDQFKSIRAIEVISATPIDDAERRAIQDQIAKDFGSHTSVSWSADGSLIGGLQVKAGDLLFDGSVRTRLEKIRAALVQ